MTDATAPETVTAPVAPAPGPAELAAANDALLDAALVAPAPAPETVTAPVAPAPGPAELAAANDALLDAALVAPAPAPEAKKAKVRKAKTDTGACIIKGAHNQGYVGVTENGFTWVVDPADALVVVGPDHAAAIAKFAFTGHPVEIIGG